MNYLSVFSGIEAASVAWKDFNFNPLGFSEIEPFPCALLNYHYPDVKNYGDINNFKEWKIEQPIDILVGGSPCQDFSIIGKRGGGQAIRGSLMFTYGNLINYFKPRWIVWENVTGVLSSNAGKDFTKFLSMLDEYGYGLAWRVFDSQFFGSPQCRKRIFVIGYFGDIWRSYSVLFDGGTGKKHNKALRKPEYKMGAGCNTGKNDVENKRNIVFLLDQGGSKFYIKYNKTTTILKSDSSHKLIIFDEKNNILRRLTPLEIERLQGFPDNYTKIPFRKKPADYCPDGVRIMALGNSMAVPVMRWIGERILLTEKYFNKEFIKWD